MAAVSKLVRDALSARLKAAWAAKLDTAASGYEISASDLQQLMEIDWTGARAQFFQGQIGVESLENTSAIRYPLVILFAESSSHDGNEKFRTYSGSVTMALEFHYSWRKSAALPTFDEVMDLIEETVIAVFHQQSWVGAMGSGLSYRGEMTTQRGPVQEGAENWLQSLGFRLTFGVDV